MKGGLTRGLSASREVSEEARTIEMTSALPPNVIPFLGDRPDLLSLLFALNQESPLCFIRHNILLGCWVGYGTWMRGSD